MGGGRGLRGAWGVAYPATSGPHSFPSTLVPPSRFGPGSDFEWGPWECERRYASTPFHADPRTRVEEWRIAEGERWGGELQP